ncbi:ZZ-type zinc finger-containing protein 3 [Copidosoma floridanum]|uniref:ZZ-type zinc finger-containing protein 3 n=1 Tax=Copidosoma floridanum TaxID=29053 RepID=UPI0006C9A919|nr:ZZ-type zinc finger-containing protein 3 [Copidosoma floridanum]
MEFDKFNEEPSTSQSSSVSFPSGVGGHNEPSSSAFYDAKPFTSSDETFNDLLATIPDEYLTGCGPEEAFRADYKEAIFPRKRPDNVPFTEPTPSVFHEEEILDPDDNFYFESEHLALRLNHDYHNLLKTIVILHAQRTQAIKDLEQLLCAKQQALKDPIAYVAKLQNGDLPEYPGPQKIPEIPKIDWSKYNVGHVDNHLRPKTRHAQTAPKVNEMKLNEEKEKILVRGRVYNESKPETFNQKWTNEEQLRLEALLKKYPPEEIAMNRYTKIAQELGNRTAKQVSSRVQKYYIKLKKAGITTNEYYIKSTSKVKSTKRFIKTTTFFPHNHDYFEIQNEPVHGEFDESQSAGYNADVKQIQLLKQTKLEQDKRSYEPVYVHLGHKCYICNEEPIKNIRWHCEDCYNHNSKYVDLCTNCAYSQVNNEKPQHPINHKLIRIDPPKSSDSCLDSAYHPQNFNEHKFNYLDTNYGLE